MLLICPKCGSGYERHPLTPAAQELCPACRNQASWDEIKTVLAQAASGTSSGAVTANGGVSGARPGVRPGVRSDARPPASSLAVQAESWGRPAFSGGNALVIRAAGDPFAPRVPVSELARVTAEAPRTEIISRAEVVRPEISPADSERPLSGPSMTQESAASSLPDVLPPASGNQVLPLQQPSAVLASPAVGGPSAGQLEFRFFSANTETRTAALAQSGLRMGLPLPSPAAGIKRVGLQAPDACGG